MKEGKFTPTYTGISTGFLQEYQTSDGWVSRSAGYVTVRCAITFQTDPSVLLREIDKAQRALSRLRYPPKAPAKGSVSRRREKLRKAGVLR